MIKIGRGTWKGRVLRPKLDCRITSGIVRKAVFDILGPGWCEDRNVADLCCGCGSVGLTALSEGAGKAIFIDKDSRAVEYVRNFLMKTNSKKDTEIICGDVRAKIRIIDPFIDMIYFDPPYNKKILYDWVLDYCWDKLLSPGGYMFVESGSEIDLPTGWKSRNYGTAVLNWYIRNM